MEKIIAIYGSPNTTEGSRTFALMSAFVDEYLKLHPDTASVKWINLNEDKVITNSIFNVNNRETWFANPLYVNELLTCDKLVIGSPVNNFTISTLVKNWLDHIIFASKSFKMVNGKLIGLLTNLKVQILVTKGGEKNPTDIYSIGYLKDIFNLLGATVSEPILIAQTDRSINWNLSPTQIIAKHHEEIIAAVKKF